MKNKLSKQELIKQLIDLLTININKYVEGWINYSTLCSRQSRVWEQAKAHGVGGELAMIFTCPPALYLEDCFGIESADSRSLKELVRQAPVTPQKQDAGEYPVYVPQSKQPLLPSLGEEREHPQEEE